MIFLRTLILASVFFVMTSPVCRAAESVAPADPGLNARGRAILAYFQALQAAPELKLVSGQFCGWSGSASFSEMSKIHEATGQWPAMIGLDYCTWVEGEAAIGIAQPNRLAEAYWRDGGLVNISWHAPNPANAKGGGLRDKGVDLATLLVKGTPVHDRWMASLDQVAAGLAELQEAGVIVIWRPLHEMNGGWFWWGGKPPGDFIAVWRHMFDYLTHTKGLHNLVWAYGPNHGRQTAAYYPGDAYTDLIGLDAYTDHIDESHIKGYPDLVRIKKVFGLTEYGPHGAANPPGNFDYRRLLDGVAEHFPAARHFLCWNEKWNPAENHFAREFYNDPRVITRASLPEGLAGKAKADGR